MKMTWLVAASAVFALSGCASEPGEETVAEAPAEVLEQTLTSVDRTVSMPLVGNWIIEQEDHQTMAAVLDEEEGGKLWLTVDRYTLERNLEDYLKDLDESNTPLIQWTDTGYPYVSYVPKEERDQDWQTDFSIICKMEGSTVVVATVQYYRHRDWLLGKPGSDIWRRVNKSINSIQFH